MPEIKQSGYQTKLKDALVNLFSTSGIFYTISGILEYLNTIGLEPNKTSIYRQLSSMEIDEKIYCTKINSNQCWGQMVHKNHDHFVCLNCQKISCIHFKLETKNLIQSEIKSEISVFMKSIRIEGLCSSCNH